MNPYLQYMYSYPHKTAYGPLYGVRLEQYADRLSGSENSLYFHIPFCQSKCGYCNLFSVTGQSEAAMEQYVGAMERQARQWSASFPQDVEFADLTLGGGTPLLLPERQLERVFRIATEGMGFEPAGRHIVVETSPGQTTEEKLWLLKEHHVTRVSMGVQSFRGEDLEAIHRSHSVEQVERALECIQKVGFTCVNLDLIYGIPGQTVSGLWQSLERALAYEPEELFVYPLYIKKDTYLYNKGVRRPSQTYEMYVQLRAYLRERGYRPYSMRRFVKETAADVSSDVGSCGFGNTVSIGCGARSYIGNLHFCTPYSVRQSQCRELMRKYIQEEDYREIRHGYLLTDDEQKQRFIIKNILFGCGLSLTEYETAFSGEAQKEFPILRDWVRRGYAKEQAGRILLTEQGFCLSDYLGPMLISDEVREKMCRSDVSPLELPGGGSS